MDRIYSSGAAGSAPSVPASPSSGYPTAGNPGTGTPATKPGPYWYHMIMEELMAVIVAAGITPASGTLNQLLQALRAAGVFVTQAVSDDSTKVATTAWVRAAMSNIASAAGFAASFGASQGYIKLPSWLGGWIAQWGVVVTSSSADTTVNYPIAFPNAARSVVGTVGAGTTHITFTTSGTTPTSFICNAISVGGRNASSCSWLSIGN